MPIDAGTAVHASRGYVWERIEDETVVLDDREGCYYGLDGVGARIWELIQEPRTVASLVTAIVGEYQVDREVCERDVLDLVSALRDSGLVEVADGSTSSDPA